jgi:putative multiple sugar transport system substrate-binding protein
VLQKAADKGVKVIAYDRLIKKSKNVDYYATFDNFEGRRAASRIRWSTR